MLIGVVAASRRVSSAHNEESEPLGEHGQPIVEYRRSGRRDREHDVPGVDGSGVG